MRKPLVFMVFAVLLMAATCDRYNQVVKSTDKGFKLEKAKEYYNKGNYYKALPLLEELLVAYRGDSLIETVYYYYCYTHYGQGTYLMAAQYFKYFYSSFPRSKHAEEMLWMSAMSYRELSPVPDLDQTYTHKAIEALQLFVNLYPESPRVADANSQIDDMWDKLETKDFNSAMLYYRRGQYKAAATGFANLLEDYPVSDRDEQVQYMRVRSLFLLAENSTERRKAERYQDAELACNEFLTTYPDSKRAEDVLDMKSKSQQFSNRQLP